MVEARREGWFNARQKVGNIRKGQQKGHELGSFNPS